MEHKSFLQAVAEAYVSNERDNLIDYCFIFPNKRNVTFFTEFMAEASRNIEAQSQRPRALVMPAMTTIVDFIEEFNPSFKADRMEMLFILFDVYRQVVTEKQGKETASKLDFNKFIQWADVLINDFDDVDNSLADPRQIFKNVENLKEISANYLTPEQREIIRRYWDEEQLPDEVKAFWNHITYEPSGNAEQKEQLVGKFVRLWQVMLPLYEAFNERLESEGMHRSGMAYRRALAQIKNENIAQLPFKRYIFVGFSQLNKVEEKIFAVFRDKSKACGEQVADFYWDTSSPAFRHPGIGGRTVLDYAREFPSLYPVIEPIEEFPNVEVIGVASRVGQAKVVASRVARFFPENHNAEDLRKIAIVLPEENMLTPVLNSLPPELSPLNITMGYQLRNTGAAGLLRDVISMQLRARGSAMRPNTFFHEDVRNVLSHPLVRSFNPELCINLLRRIETSRLFNVPESLFREPEFSGMEAVFTHVAEQRNPESVFRYLKSLLEWVMLNLRKSLAPDSQNELAAIKDDDIETAKGRTAPEAPVADDAESETSIAIQEAFLRSYANAVIRLQGLCSKYLNDQISRPTDVTLFQLIERMVAGETVNFEGVPLQGIQIMGVLEARSLDFDTLIIPSMNEKIFPRAKFTTSFIPTALRNAYNLPTPDDQESMYTYFFYRMISRAKNVVLIYDARTSGGLNKEISRYIRQLQYIFRLPNLDAKVLSYNLALEPPQPLFVQKTPEILRVIEEYFTPGGNRRFSASSIKRLIGCPMAFYLEKIAGYAREDDFNDWMNESEYGTIVHAVFENIYNELLHERGRDYDIGGRRCFGVQVTAAMLKAIIDNKLGIERHIVRAINFHYLKLGENNDTPLQGDAAILATLIHDYVRTTLEREMRHTPFIYLHGEEQRQGMLTVADTDGRTVSFNFDCRIDRVDFFIGDEMNRYRIIDYKTGADETSITSLEKAFSDHRETGFVQLMLYSIAYNQLWDAKGPIQPMLFALRKLMVSDIAPMLIYPPDSPETTTCKEMKAPQGRSKKWKLLDYGDYEASFNSRLIKLFDDLRNPNIPFTPNTEEGGCNFCAFADICKA